MKKLTLLLCVMLLIAHLGLGFAEVKDDELTLENTVESSVMINGNYLTSDTPHLLVNDTMYIVGRYLVEALGGQIEWNGDLKEVTIILDEQKMVLGVGKNTVYVDDQEVTLEHPVFLKDDRVMIPLRFVAEYFGAEVSWHQNTYTVVIEKDGIEVPEEYQVDRGYTDDDLYILSKIVTVESGDVSLEMAMAIANTVLNRVEHQEFPSTVADVIYQIDVHVQFPPAHKESFKTLSPSFLATKASKKALEGVNVIGPSLFFNNAPFPSKTDDLIRIIDGEYFYK